MKIKDIKVFVCRQGRNFVTVKVVTEDGTYGLGDATLNGREMAVVAYLEEHVIPCLIGKDAHQIEDIWQYLYKGAYWQNGAVSIAAIASVDMALWDIKGKLANMPVYQLLGGKSRKGVFRKYYFIKVIQCLWFKGNFLHQLSWTFLGKLSLKKKKKPTLINKILNQ